jgi:phospholipase/lecithinase/hemolysin
MPHYGDAHRPPWNATNSIFVMFAGVVDLIMMNGIREEDKLDVVNTNLTIIYSKLLESLYGTGARNFILLNIPPLERCWQPGENGPSVSKKLKSDGDVYRQRVQNAAEALKKRFKESNVFLLDTEKLFNQALADPNSFPQTSGILNTTTPCMEYQRYVSCFCGSRVIS